MIYLFYLIIISKNKAEVKEKTKWDYTQRVWKFNDVYEYST
jgi:hypothetical protein